MLSKIEAQHVHGILMMRRQEGKHYIAEPQIDECSHYYYTHKHSIAIVA
jgi:hypothetical protein